MSENYDVVRYIKGWVVPFVLLFFALAFLSYMTVSSLLRPISWGILMAFVSYPSYRFFLRMVGGRHKNFAAGAVTFLVIMLFVFPCIFFGVLVSREAISIFGKIYDMVGSLDTVKGFSLEVLLPDVVTRELVPIFNEYPFLKDGAQQFLRWITSTLVGLSRNFLGNIVTLVYHQIIIFIVLFFLLRDGHVILNYIKDIVPLMSDERREFMARSDQVLRAVVFGVVITAAVQGLLGAAGWWYVGLSSPLLAGALMAFLAMIPFVGTPLVWIPGSIYLFMVGNIKDGVILFLWGICVVSAIDNFLRPYFISEKAQMSTLLVFIGAMGGFAAMGFIGLFMGPLILSLFVFFLDSYRRAWKIYQIDKRSRDAANGEKVEAAEV